MGSALGKLFWFAKSAVPGESFSVLVPWWQAGHKVIGDDMMYWWRARSVTCWMTKVGPFFFSKREDEPFIIPVFGVLLTIQTQLGWDFCRRKISKPIELWSALASGNLQWEVLFMMVMVMIIDSCYYKHHYYLVLIHSCMEGAQRTQN